MSDERINLAENSEEKKLVESDGAESLSSCISELSIESFHRISEQMLYRCIVSMTELISQQIERLPSQLELLSASSSRESLPGSSHSVPDHVKSTMKSLSEDAWTIFHSLTCLIRQRASRSPSPDKFTTDTNQPQAINAVELRDQLERLVSRVHEFDRVSQETLLKSDIDLQRPQISSLVARLRERSRSGASVASSDKLNRRLVDFYEAAKEMGTFAGQKDALQNMAMVLSELDCLVTSLDDQLASDIDTDQRSYEYDEELIREGLALSPKHGRHLLGGIVAGQDKEPWDEEEAVFESASSESRSLLRSNSQYKLNKEEQKSRFRERLNETSLEKSRSISEEKNVGPKCSLTLTDSGKGTLCSTDTERNHFSKEFYNKHQINDNPPLDKLRQKERTFRLANAELDSQCLTCSPQGDSGENSTSPIKCDSGEAVHTVPDGRPHGRADNIRLSSPHLDKASCTHLETTGSLDRQTTDRDSTPSRRTRSYGGKHSWLESSADLEVLGDKSESTQSSQSKLDTGSWERLDKTHTQNLASLYSYFDFAPDNRDSDHLSRLATSGVTIDSAQTENPPKAHESPELTKTHVTNGEVTNLAIRRFLDATDDGDKIPELQVPVDSRGGNVTGLESCVPNNLSDRSENSEGRASNISLKLAENFWTRQSTGCSEDEESTNHWVSDFYDSTVRQINEIIAERKSSLANSVDDKKSTGQDSQLHDFRAAVQEAESIYSNSHYQPESGIGERTNKPSEASGTSSDSVAERNSSSADSYNDPRPRRKHSGSSNGSLFESTIRQLNEMIANKIISAANSVQEMLVIMTDSTDALENSDGDNPPMELEAHQFSDLMEVVKSTVSERQYYQSKSRIGEKVSGSGQISHLSLHRGTEKHASYALSDNGQNRRQCSASTGSLFENTIKQLNEMIANKILSAACSDGDMRVTNAESTGILPQQGLRASVDLCELDRPETPTQRRPSDTEIIQSGGAVKNSSGRTPAYTGDTRSTKDQSVKRVKDSPSIRSLYESAVLQLTDSAANKVQPTATSEQQVCQGDSLQSTLDGEGRLFDEVVTSNSTRQYTPSRSATGVNNIQSSHRSSASRCEDVSAILIEGSPSPISRRISMNSDQNSEENVKSNNDRENSLSDLVASNDGKESSVGISRDGLDKTDYTAAHEYQGSSFESPYKRAVRQLAEMQDRKLMLAENRMEVVSQTTSDDRLQNKQIDPVRLLREIGLIESESKNANDTSVISSLGRQRMNNRTTLSGDDQAFERAFNSGTTDDMQDASFAESNKIILSLFSKNGADDWSAGLPDDSRFQNTEYDKAQARRNARIVSECGLAGSGRKGTLTDVCPVCDQVCDTLGNVDLKDREMPSNEIRAYVSSADGLEILSKSVAGRSAMEDRDGEQCGHASRTDGQFGLNPMSSRNSVSQKSMTDSWSRLDRDELVASSMGSSKALYQSLPSQSVQSHRSTATSQQNSCPKCGKSISRIINDQDEESVHTYTVSSREELFRRLQVNGGEKVTLNPPSVSVTTASGCSSLDKEDIDASVTGDESICRYGQELNKSDSSERMGPKESIKRSLAEHCFSSERRLIESSAAIVEDDSMGQRVGDMRSENSENSSGRNNYKTSSGKLCMPSGTAPSRESSVASARSSRKALSSSQKGSVAGDKSPVSSSGCTGYNDRTPDSIRSDKSSMIERNPSDTTKNWDRETSRQSSRHERIRERSTADSEGYTGYGHDTGGQVESDGYMMGQSTASDTILCTNSFRSHERSRASLQSSDDRFGHERRDSSDKDDENLGHIISDRNLVLRNIPSNTSVGKMASATRQRSYGVRRSGQVLTTTGHSSVDGERTYSEYSGDEHGHGRPDSYRPSPKSIQSMSIESSLSSAGSQQHSADKLRGESRDQEIYVSERRNCGHISDDLDDGLMQRARSSARQTIQSDGTLSNRSNTDSTSPWSILDKEMSISRSDDSIATQGECYSFSEGEDAGGRSVRSYTLTDWESERIHSQDAPEIPPISIDPDPDVYFSDEGGQSLHDKDSVNYRNDSFIDTLDQALHTSDAALSHMSSHESRGSLSHVQDTCQVRGYTPPRATSDSQRNFSSTSSSKSSRLKSIRTSSSEGSKASVTSERRFYSSSSSEDMSDEECSKAEKQNGATNAECQKQDVQERDMNNRSSELFRHLEMSVPGMSLPRYLTPSCKSVGNISWTVFPTASRSCPSLHMSPMKRLTKWSYSNTMARPDISDGVWRLLISIVTYFCFFFTAFIILGSAINTKNLSISDCSSIFFEDIYKNLEYKHINGACF